jgi:hypothetical protein
MLNGLLRPNGQSRAGKSVETFGWLMLVESLAVLLVPQWVAALLLLDPLSAQSLTYFRIGGMLIGGLGMLYIISHNTSALLRQFARHALRCVRLRRSSAARARVLGRVRRTAAMHQRIHRVQLVHVVCAARKT